LLLFVNVVLSQYPLDVSDGGKKVKTIVGYFIAGRILSGTIVIEYFGTLDCPQTADTAVYGE